MNEKRASKRMWMRVKVKEKVQTAAIASQINHSTLDMTCVRSFMHKNEKRAKKWENTQLIQQHKHYFCVRCWSSFLVFSSLAFAIRISHWTSILPSAKSDLPLNVVHNQRYAQCSAYPHWHVVKQYKRWWNVYPTIKESPENWFKRTNQRQLQSTTAPSVRERERKKVIDFTGLFGKYFSSFTIWLCLICSRILNRIRSEFRMG